MPPVGDVGVVICSPAPDERAPPVAQAPDGALFVVVDEKSDDSAAPEWAPLRCNAFVDGEESSDQ